MFGCEVQNVSFLTPWNNAFNLTVECNAMFRFLMSSVYKLHEAVAESTFLGLVRAEVAEGDEPMSFDVKRPSVFLAEARAYLSAMQFVDSFGKKIFSHFPEYRDLLIRLDSSGGLHRSVAGGFAGAD